MLVKFGLTDDDGVLDKSEFVILSMVRAVHELLRYCATTLLFYISTVRQLFHHGCFTAVLLLVTPLPAH